MNYFPDSKKEFLENVLMSSTENYRSRSRQLIIDLANNPSPYLPEITSTFQPIFQNFSEAKPMILLNSLRFLKEIMDLKSQIIASAIEKSIYPDLLKLARFHKNDKEDEDRGRLLFSMNVDSMHESKDKTVIGNSCLRLCLECILMWRLYYPRTQFEVQAEKLLEEGVKFPSDIYYFKKFENYLKNPRDKRQMESLELHESNDSPDNLFVGYQSEVDVLNKIEKGIEEFENAKKEFQKALLMNNGQLLQDKNLTRAIEKIQEVGKKSFKMQETVMHSNLEASVSNKLMDLLYENEELFEEVIEDYKQLTSKQIKEAFFLAKYRGNITNSEGFNKEKSSLSNISDKFPSVEKIQAYEMTKNEFINKFGKDTATFEKQMSGKLDQPNPDHLETGQRGQFFTESEEIPRESQQYSGKLELKKVEFNSLQHNQQPFTSHYPYLEKHLAELKNKEKRNSGTLIGQDFKLPKNPAHGDATINTVSLNNDKFPFIPNSVIRPTSDMRLEERDQINNLSQHIPTLGGIYWQSSKLLSDDLSSNNEDLVIERRKLLEKLEILKQNGLSIEENRNFSIAERKELLIRRIEEKNQQISLMKEKLRSVIKMSENLHSDTDTGKLQQKYKKLQTENKLLKHFLKMSSNPSTGYSSVVLNQKNTQRPMSTQHSRNNSIRSFKVDNRGPVISGEQSSKLKSVSLSFEEKIMKEIQITANFKENIQRLKICCLKNKSVLFKSSELQIGVLTDLQNYKERKLWKIYLFFENLSTNNIITNLILRFKASENINIWVKNQQECLSVLKPHEQIKREVIIEHKFIPFQLATLDFTYQLLDKVTRNTIALPNSIIKFVNFLNIENKEVEIFWNKHKEKAIQIDNFEISPNFFEDSNSFESFFPFFSEKKSIEKIETVEKKVFFCKFSVFGVEKIVKLNVLTQKGKFFAVLKMIGTENPTENAELNEFLLNSLRFVLVKCE